MSFCRKYWPALGFLALTLIFFFKFLDGNLVFAFKDLSRYFYPLRHLMVEQVRVGQLPLWNPYLFCGFPLLATLQIGFFYPLSIIHYLMPFSLAFNYYTISHYFLAACFMYLLLRHFKLEKSPAFFGGLVFAFSGYLVSVSNMNTSLSSVIWLPLALLFFDKLINAERGMRNAEFVWLSGVLALMFLGGEPTILYVTAAFLLFYGLVFAQKKLFSLVWLGLSLLLAFGLTGIQLLPFLELSRLSDRVVLTNYDIVSFRSFPPRELITFILPYFFGNAGQLGSYTETLLGEVSQDWLISTYLGVIPLLLALFSFRRRRALFFGLAALAALFLAFGRYTFIYPLAYKLIPGIALIRFPVKFLFLTTFCLALLSAFGLQAVIADPERLKRRVPLIAGLTGGFSVLFLAGWLLAGNIFAYFVSRYPGIPRVFFQLLLNLIRFNLQSLMNLVVYLLIMLLVFWLFTQKKISRAVFAAVIIMITAIDLFANNSTVAVGAQKEIFLKTPAIYTLLQKEKGLYRFFCTFEMRAENQIIYGDTYSEALFNAKDNFAGNWPLLNHFYDLYGYESVKPYPFSHSVQNEFAAERVVKNINSLSRLNVKYIISAKELKTGRLKLLRHKYRYGQNVYIYENPDVLPRAFLLNDLGRPDLRARRVDFKRYRPGELEMIVNAKTPATLFLSEAYYPGWKFYVDGQEQPVIKANELFSAVRVGAGEHRVRFVYDPLSLKLGALISGLTILLAIGLLLVRRR